jgi:hypothetical protein
MGYSAALTSHVVEVTLVIPITPEEKAMFDALEQEDQDRWQNRETRMTEAEWKAKGKIIFFNILRRVDVDHIDTWDV